MLLARGAIFLTGARANRGGQADGGARSTYQWVPSGVSSTLIPASPSDARISSAVAQSFAARVVACRDPVLRPRLVD